MLPFQRLHPSPDQQVQIEQCEVIRSRLRRDVQQRGDSLLSWFVREGESTFIESEAVAPAVLQTASRQRPDQPLVACPEGALAAHVHVAR